MPVPLGTEAETEGAGCDAGALRCVADKHGVVALLCRQRFTDAMSIAAPRWTGLRCSCPSGAMRLRRARSATSKVS